MGAVCLLLFGAAGLRAQEKKPVLVLLEGDAAMWQGWCSQRGWQLLTPWAESAGKPLDARVKALETQVLEAAHQPGRDPGRVYLAAQAGGAALVFYVAARVPDLWAAAVALSGSPQPAIDTNRLFAANTAEVPVLWLSAVKGDDALAQKLRTAGLNLEYRYEQSANPNQIFDWLAAHRKDEFPASIDCETGSPLFARCYWIEVTRFDPGERNDVLDSSRIKPKLRAALAAGPFGFELNASGPGPLVSQLPQNYKGPLKLNDRIVAVGGKPLADAAAYVAFMEQATEEKPVVITVKRGDDRIRIDTSIVLPKPEELVTARVQAKYLPDAKEVQILSRSIAALKVTLPDYWTPAALNWNGTEAVKADAPGCWQLSLHNEVAKGGKCP